MTTADLVSAGLYLVPALIWAIFTGQLWSYRRRVRPRSQALRLLPLGMGLVTLHLFLHVAASLLPPEVRDDPRLRVLFQLSMVVTLAVGRHLFRLLPLPENRPGRAWLVVNYGAAVVAALGFATRVLPGWAAGPAGFGHVMISMGLTTLGVLFVLELVRVVRPGAWGPEHAGEIRRWDLMLIGGGLGATGAVALLAALAGAAWLTSVLLEVGMSLSIIAPTALGALGYVAPEFLAMVALLAAVAAGLATHGWALAYLDPRWHMLVQLATVLGLGFVLTAGYAWLRGRINQLVLRRSLHQQAALQEFLGTLSPELGTHECCRRALAELVRVRRLPGAAILLLDGEAVVEGTFDVEPLRRVWPRGAAADALPARCFGTAELRELPLVLREALIEAQVGLGATPILSPRRRWGHLFMCTGLLRGIFREDDLEAFVAFVAQLALVLDAADLLARTVAVERSLAHAEKLAAIGETAARIAHEIRNPVTAARSLAQQLAREPAAPFRDELGVILSELERVERQVAALLRFARREEFRLEAVDLGELVRATVGDYGPRLTAAAIAVAVDTTPGVVARADREKLRQALVNLIENAIDALREAAGERRLILAVAGRNGTASLRVADSGPGVSADALPRLFEPFFSTKATGTGLGLAIVRRTIEALGGRITAASPAGEGMTVAIELPAVEEGRA